MIVRPSDRSGGALLEFQIAGGEIVQRPIAVNLDSRQYIARVDVVSEPGPGPLLVKRVQGDNSGIDNPLSLSFTTPVIEGDLLILAFMTSGSGAHVIGGNGGTGWTLVAGPGTHSSIYWKAASSADAALTPFTVTVDDNTSISIVRKGFLLEYEQMAPSAVGDVGAFDNSQLSVTSRSSGTTGTTAQANELAVAIFGQGTGGTTNQAWTNGFTQLATVSRGWLVTKVLTATGTQETTMSWTTSAIMTSAIATFKAADPTPGPVSERQYVSRFVEFEVEAAAPVVYGTIPGLLVELDRDDLIEFGFVLDDPVRSLLDSGNTLDRVSVISWDEDISEWVRSGSTDRGGQRELERTAEAGTGHLVLDNRDGRFTPFNVSSPYYPDIIPLRRIRIRAEWNGTIYPIFQGFVESWPVSFPDEGDNIVTVQLVDGFELLANDGAKVSGAFPQQQTGERVAAVLLAAGFAPTEMVVDTGVSTVAAVTLTNANVLEHIQSMAHVEQGRFFVDRTGLFVFTERGSTGQPDMSTRTWADDGSGMSYRDITLVFDKSLILNDVRLTREGGTEQIVQDLASYQKYNWRTKVETGLPLSSDAQVLDLAQRYIDGYHEPVLRIEGLVDDAMQHRLWDRVLEREYADLVTVLESQTQVLQVSAIEGIHHDFGENVHIVSLRVSPTVVENYARLDDAAFRLDDNFILGR